MKELISIFINRLSTIIVIKKEIKNIEKNEVVKSLTKD